MIGRSLGSMNDVKDVVEDVLLLAGGLSAHGLCNEKQELLSRQCWGHTPLPTGPCSQQCQSPLGLPHMMFAWEKARENKQRCTRMLPWQGAEGVSSLASAKGEE